MSDQSPEGESSSVRVVHFELPAGSATLLLAYDAGVRAAYEKASGPDPTWGDSGESMYRTGHRMAWSAYLMVGMTQDVTPDEMRALQETFLRSWESPLVEDLYLTAQDVLDIEMPGLALMRLASQIALGMGHWPRCGWPAFKAGLAAGLVSASTQFASDLQKPVVQEIRAAYLRMSGRRT